jgi:YggT family protein
VSGVGGSAAGAIIDVLLYALQALQWIVIIAALISWVNPDPRNPIVRFLYTVTEPLFRPVRRLIPPSRTGGIDLSPLVVILVIYLLSRFLARLAFTGGF